MSEGLLGIIVLYLILYFAAVNKDKFDWEKLITSIVVIVCLAIGCFFIVGGYVGTLFVFIWSILTGFFELFENEIDWFKVIFALIILFWVWYVIKSKK